MEMAMTVISVVVVMSFALMAMAVMAQGPWDTAEATFYGDMSGNATMGEFSCLSLFLLLLLRHRLPLSVQ